MTASQFEARVARKLDQLERLCSARYEIEPEVRFGNKGIKVADKHILETIFSLVEELIRIYEERHDAEILEKQKEVAK